MCIYIHIYIYIYIYTYIYIHIHTYIHPPSSLNMPSIVPPAVSSHRFCSAASHRCFLTIVIFGAMRPWYLVSKCGILNTPVVLLAAPRAPLRASCEVGTQVWEAAGEPVWGSGDGVERVGWGAGVWIQNCTSTNFAPALLIV